MLGLESLFKADCSEGQSAVRNKYGIQKIYLITVRLSTFSNITSSNKSNLESRVNSSKQAKSRKELFSRKVANRFHPKALFYIYLHFSLIHRFNETLDIMRNRHKSVVETMAEGVKEMKEHGLSGDVNLLDSRVQYFLDRFYMSRISIRMLIHQHRKFLDES